MTVLLVVLAVGFAFAIGAHYTGACMGRPHARGAASLYGILRGWLIGPGAGITAGFLLALAAKAAGAVLLAQA